MKALESLWLILVCSIVVSACSATGQEDTTRLYVQALDSMQGYPLSASQAGGHSSPEETASEKNSIPDPLVAFIQLYQNLHTNPDLQRQIETVYAESLFFNDTLHTFTHRDQLSSYLQRITDKTEQMEIEILGWSISDQDVHLRWAMDTQFRVLGRSVKNRTLGMSHLRFDHQGRIILHQDFWDSSQGFYEHIPVLGNIIRVIRNRV